jgi:hypothetical protein
MLCFPLSLPFPPVQLLTLSPFHQLLHVLCVRRKEWLQLWDHLLAYAERPQLLLYAVIGYVMQQRAALLDARTKGTALYIIGIDRWRWYKLEKDRNFNRSDSPSVPSSACVYPLVVKTEEVEALMHRQNPINMTKLLKTAHRLDASTPASLLRALRRPSFAPPAAGPNGSSTSTSTPAAVGALSSVHARSERGLRSSRILLFRPPLSFTVA